MSTLKRFLNVVAQTVVKSSKWVIFIAVIIVALRSPAHTILDVLAGFSVVAQCVLAVVLVIAYLVNLDALNRSLDKFFSKEKILTLVLVMIGLFVIAVYVDQLVPGYSKLGAGWGWSADILLCLLVLIWIAKATRPVHVDISECKLYLDNPDNSKQKLTDIQQIAYDRISMILKEPTDVSIALTGSWGAGKTKILNDLKRDHERILWFSFYPWAYTSEEALVKDFYIQLTESIDSVLPRISSNNSKILNSVKRLINGRATDGLLSMIANIILDIIGKARNPEDLIDDRLKGENLRVVVVVDDLERTSDKAIINRALQLVHHLRRRNIKGVRVIAAFEREAIIDALPSHIQGHGRLAFIEKFFDIEVSLLDPRPDDIRGQLIDSIPEQLAPSYISQSLLSDLRSHRAVIRLANEYQLASSINGTDAALNNIVHMNDFIVFTHIKIKYPFIYRDIAQNRHIYTQYKYIIDGERMGGSEDEVIKYKRAHIDAMFERSGLYYDTADRLREILADIFPDAAKALGKYSSNNKSDDARRRERRISLRAVLDATLGASEDLVEIINHEKEVERVIKTLERAHTEDDVAGVVDRFINYVTELKGDTWYVPISILTNEIGKKNEDLRDNIIELTKVFLKYTLQLGEEYDNNFKVRLLGLAFDIFTDNLLNREQLTEQKSEYVRQLSLVKLADSSQTPLGSLLLARLDLSNAATEVKKYLSEKEVDKLRLKTRRHFERYYIQEGHDMVLETPDLFAYLDKGWQEMIGGYSAGKGLYNNWLIGVQRAHPSYFLDQYTTKSFRGNWAFKEENFGEVKPVKGVTPGKLKIILRLVDAIEGSDNLSEDDMGRIKMIRNYAETNTNKESRDSQD